MDTPHLAVVFVILIWSGHVNAFSISRRAERSTDLADALAILQRQRRRVGAEDFLGPERLLDGRPLTLEDVSDWLSRSRGVDSEDNDVDSAWMSDRGDFQDFENEARLRGYELPALPPPQPSDRMLDIPNTVRPSQTELDDIFDEGDQVKDDTGAQDGIDPTSSAQNILEKKKKEVMLNVKDRDMQVVQKKSMMPSPSAVENTSDGNLSLDTLTKDEFKALMKAVAKLQKQANRLNEVSNTESGPKHLEVKETIVEPIPPIEEIAVVEPVSKDELESVFEETEGPILTETIVKETDGEYDTMSDKELLTNIAEEVDEERQRELTDALASELASDVVEEQAAEEEAAAEAAKEEIEAEQQEESAEEDTDMPNVKNIDPENLATIEKYWLMSNYLNTNSLQKRAVKRSYFTLPEAAERSDGDVTIDDIISSRAGDDGDDVDDDDDVDDVDNFDLAAMTASANLQSFVTKILELQQELDRLRIVARLEDLENDVLTDALNEATLSQKAGTVSDIEFQALQQAIRIEEALQDMKKAKMKAQSTRDIKKRGEPWRRKKQPTLSRDDDALITDVALPSFPSKSRVTVPQISRADMSRVLHLTYPSDVDDDTDPEFSVASLFLSNADDCPAVREYSTNCELADMYALPVDYEARSLCNLHEMCYACGHSLKVPQVHCDLVYRAAASALCQSKDSCLSESEIFLRAMKLRTRYVQHEQLHCRSTCAARFLGML